MNLGQRLERILDLGTVPEDDIQRIRLVRQVNGLNIFYIVIAFVVGVFVLAVAPTSRPLYLVQFGAFALYLVSFLLTVTGHFAISRAAILHIFEWHLFFGNILMNVWGSPALIIVVLYPLLAALAEASIFGHFAVSLLQVLLVAVLHFVFPGAERSILAFSSLSPTAVNAIQVMSLGMIPFMAAVIISIIFRENVRAREKTKRMLNEITIANRQLENYAEQLKDETQRLRAEVDIARRIQTMVLPSVQEIREITSLDISCIMRPADEVGGDYYDVIGVNGTVTIGIGDVTGHGLASGIIMLMAQTAVRTIVESGVTDPIRFIELLNRTLCANIKRIGESRNMTFALVTYRDGAFSVAGQHESLILCRTNGEVEIHDTQSLGFYLGMVADVFPSLDTFSFTMAPGDLLVLYSDGVAEAANRDGAQYSLERLASAANAARALPAERVKDRIMKDLYNFVGDAPVEDDVSLVIIKQK
jgi:serine phosphatase RsbU (regulator of sigma subunit)